VYIPLEACYNTYMMRKTLLTAALAVATATTAIANAPTQLERQFNDITASYDLDAKLYILTNEMRNANYPVLRGMPRNAIGFAAQVNGLEGQCLVFIDEEVAEKPLATSILEHEIGHCLSWQKYGLNVRSHGNEWKSTCREYATSFKSCQARY
jgi:uncharacterized protein YjaZ